MFRAIVGFLALWAGVNAAPTESSTSSPRVQVRNGTYAGMKNTGYNQDFFLGIPFAQQPVGDLRFTVPQSLNESWKGDREATQYSDICVGYGVSLFTCPLNICRMALAKSDRRIRSGIPCLKPVLPSMSSGIRL